DHAPDELADAVLTLRRAEGTPEVLRHHDVGRQLGPWPRHLDVALLEDGLSALALDDGRADVPLDLVIRVHTFGHEVPGETQPDARAARRRGRRLPRLPPTTSLLPRPLHGHRHHPPALPDIAFR